MALSLDTTPAKSVIVIRNGDNKKKRTRFIVNPRRIRSLDAFLGEVTNVIQPSSGAIRRLYTPTGRRKIESIADLDNGGLYIAMGSERFKKLDYKSEGTVIARGFNPQKITLSRPGYLADDPPPRQLPKRNKLYAQRSAQFYKIFMPIRISVFKNGYPLDRCHQFLIQSKELKHFETILETISQKLRLIDGAVRKLYTLEGLPIVGVNDLQDGGSYVAAGNRRFIQANYGNSLQNMSMQSKPKLPPISRSTDDGKSSSYYKKEINDNINNGSPERTTNGSAASTALDSIPEAIVTPKTIAMITDSILAMFDPEKFSRRYDVRLFMVNSYTVLKDAVDRLSKDVVGIHPEAVYIHLGVNDIKGGTEPSVIVDDAIASLKTLIWELPEETKVVISHVIACNGKEEQVSDVNYMLGRTLALTKLRDGPQEDLIARISYNKHKGFRLEDGRVNPNLFENNDMTVLSEEGIRVAMGSLRKCLDRALKKKKTKGPMQENERRVSAIQAMETTHKQELDANVNEVQSDKEESVTGESEDYSKAQDESIGQQNDQEEEQQQQPEYYKEVEETANESAKEDKEVLEEDTGTVLEDEPGDDVSEEEPEVRDNLNVTPSPDSQAIIAAEPEKSPIEGSAEVDSVRGRVSSNAYEEAAEQLVGRVLTSVTAFPTAKEEEERNSDTPSGQGIVEESSEALNVSATSSPMKSIGNEQNPNENLNDDSLTKASEGGKSPNGWPTSTDPGAPTTNGNTGKPIEEQGDEVVENVV